ncbi:MAG TPA: hypothetical protein PLK06_00300 [bacterium]|nr:hypothetical protein [bacterium]
MLKLWYTGFVVAAITFVVLAYVEWRIPGFVSQVFPLTYVLAVAVVCGLMSLLGSPIVQSVGKLHKVLAIGVGLVGAIALFHAGESFGAYRLVLALVMLVLPLGLLKALEDVK